jgi:hypothetical protein
MRLSVVGTEFVLAVAARHVSAQSIGDLTAGVRVRAYGFEATEHGDRKYEITGVVATRDSAHVVLVRDGAAKFDTLPFFAMTTLQMQQGRTTRARLMATGAGVGALAGTALWLIARALPLTDGNDPAPQDGGVRSAAKVSIPILAALGLAIGSFSDTDIWVAVRIPPSVYGR